MASRRRVPWGQLTILVVIIAIVGIPVIRGWFGKLSVAVARPIGQWGQAIGHGTASFGQAKNITAERDALRQQVEDLTTKLYETNLQLETVQAAVKLTDFSTTTNHPITLASIIATSPDPGIQSIIIDKGSNDHVTMGQVVVAEHGAVVGKVVAVHQNQSTVLLLTDRQSVTAARIQNQQQSPGVIAGQRGLSLLMSFIPKNHTLKTGDTVVTSGTEPLIPPDILIGSIATTTSRSGDLFQQAVITPAAPLERLRVVGVIRQ